jgi:hypothetical protein
MHAAAMSLFQFSLDRWDETFLATIVSKTSEHYPKQQGGAA